MPFTDSGPARIFYTDSDPGWERPVLMFVHGWTCDSADWMWQLASFRTYRIVALDLRGHGRSSAPADGYTLSDYADDVLAVLSAVSVERVVLIGHSMGALICSLIADRRPDSVLGLVVVDAPYANDAADAARASAFARDVAAGDGVAKVSEWLHGADQDTTPAHLALWHRRRILAMPPHVLAETVSDVHDTSTSIANTPHSEQAWSRRKMPVLVVAADQHRAQREAPYFTNEFSRAVPFQGAGHWLHQEQPDRFNGLLNSWLDTALGPPREVD